MRLFPARVAVVAQGRAELAAFQLAMAEVEVDLAAVEAQLQEFFQLVPGLGDPSFVKPVDSPLQPVLGVAEVEHH